MRLGDLDALAENLKLLAKHEDEWRQGVILGVVSTVRNTKTIDAVPVVRCKDCKHWKPSGSEAGCCFEDMEPIGGCRWVHFCRKASDFCSYGERKDGEGRC